MTSQISSWYKPYGKHSITFMLTFGSPRIWPCVTGWVILGASKDRRPSMFRVKQSKTLTLKLKALWSFETLCATRPATQRRIQKTWILSNTAVRTSYLAVFLCLVILDMYGQITVWGEAYTTYCTDVLLHCVCVPNLMCLLFTAISIIIIIIYCNWVFTRWQ
jgi:hypothetical protein